MEEVGVVGDYIVADLVGGDLGEEFAGTVDLALFDGLELHAGHGALGLGDEVDVLDGALLE